MKQNQMIGNFTVTAIQPVEELEATLYEMEHGRSGERLVWLDRPDENKTFGIAFQTQPWDDTGVFHILEHSVLCGSEKYPVKEPFVELMKSSMNTFLNAMTFWDKTVYPVSSRNDQDFINLIRVYMDAVLFPVIHQKPEIFGQEGWHYELDQQGALSYKGVVFNEMKGAFSSPDTIAAYEVARRLFPDTCYRFVSGGDPEHIPELTYEQFCEAHRRLYHPSNAYIFLDGQMDIEKLLRLLDQEYLCRFQRAEAPGPIPYQQPVDGGVSEISYELSAGEELAGRARLVDGFVAGSFADREELMALHALADALCGDNQAPLKRCLLEKGLARDLMMDVNGGHILQTFVTVEARDVEEERFQEVSDALYGELARLAQEGLDHKRILATLDNLEFNERERDFGRMPQGLGLGLQVLQSWLYGGEPGAFLSVGDLFQRLREKCEKGYFEELARRVFLQNAHRCRVLARPSHTLGQERQQREDARLQAARAQWTPVQEQELRRYQANIEAWQAAPDAPEALAAIPMLRLDQISSHPEALPMSMEESHGLRVFSHRLPTGGITYLNLYFALDGLDGPGLSRASFLAKLLGQLATESTELEELQRKLRALFGQVSFGVESYGKQGSPAQCKAFLCAGCSVLDSKLEDALSLLAEILTQTQLDDPRRVREFLLQHRGAFAEQISMAGHQAAMTRVQAGFTAEGVVQEYSGGIEYLRWLKDLEERFDSRFPDLAKELAEMSGTIFTQKPLTLSVTGTKETAVEEAARLLATRLPEGSLSLPGGPAVKPWGPRREGIVIPADVSYAAAGGLFPSAKQGQSRVAARAVSLGYLWNAVRVQGGAYGVGLGLRDTGFGGFYSYRDPSASRTLDCYQKAGEYLRQTQEMDLTGMIIGAVAESDPLLSPRLKGKTADARYWRGITREELARVRREMLQTMPGDLPKLAGDLERLTEEGSVCVLGAQRQVDECGEKLEQVSVL